jgi:hypothetical protein
MCACTFAQLSAVSTATVQRQACSLAQFKEECQLEESESPPPIAKHFEAEATTAPARAKSSNKRAERTVLEWDPILANNKCNGREGRWQVDRLHHKTQTCGLPSQIARHHFLRNVCRHIGSNEYEVEGKMQTCLAY